MSHETSEIDSDDYLAKWAKQLATSISVVELVRLVTDYRQQAEKSRRSAADREFAKRRADALETIINTTVDEQQQ